MAFQVTQCPHCESTFHTNPRILEMAAGRVRCGACLTVFLAEDNFLSQPEQDIDDIEEESVFIGNEPGEFFDPSVFISRTALKSELADSVTTQIEAPMSAEPGREEQLPEPEVTVPPGRRGRIGDVDRDLVGGVRTHRNARRAAAPPLRAPRPPQWVSPCARWLSFHERTRPDVGARHAEVRDLESKNSNKHLSKTLTALPRPRPDARPTATRPQCRERAAERIARTARASTVQPVRSAPRGHACG